ncbi:hypothetical protein ACFSSA_14725 [Luteolibacter algae]|uniref:SLA1 homology domain-containing protein n=1 Tax=Luteolibacter algae TaxID=454151 RepID=A0ABW5DA55_9BACT
MKKLPLLLAAVGLCHPLAHARIWTSNDGRHLEADYVSSSEDDVKVKRKTDGRVLTLPLSSLTAADRLYVEGQAEENAQNATDKGEVELPKDVAELVAEKGKLIFDDNFNREDKGEKDDLGEDWSTSSESRAQGDKQNDLVDGTLVMTISPLADHSISTRHDFEESFKNLVLSLRFMLPEDGSLKLAYNDKNHKEVHAGHINGITIRTNSIHLDDERTGRFNLKYADDKSSPEAKAAMAASSKTFPLNLKNDRWYEIVTWHNDETLTVYIDGKEVASFSSPGFGHETKQNFAFAVPKIAVVDDLKMWEIKE